METLFNFTMLLFAAALILSPVFILRMINRGRIKYKFLVYISISLVTTLIIMVYFAWWSDESDTMLLRHYGFDDDGLNEPERFLNVSAENIERVKKIEKRGSGLGWPVRAIMSYVWFLPYLFIVYGVYYLINKIKGLRRESKSV